MKNAAPSLLLCLSICVIWSPMAGPADAAVPQFGTADTFDIMTWNLESFPVNGQTTVNKVAEVVEDLDVDVIALQEIVSASDFDSLVAMLDGWDGYRATSSYDNLNAAYLWNTATVTLDRFSEIFQSNPNFPRHPLVMKFEWGGVDVEAINLHLRCCDTGEDARRAASEALQGYLVNQMSLPGERNFIVLGDFNDKIDDPVADNVFQNFVDDDEHFLFATMELCGDSSQWSWPHWPDRGIIDHILLTADLFDEYDSTGFIETQRLDDYLGSTWYFDNVTDHRPVAMRIELFPAPDCTDEDGDGYAVEGGECGAVDCDDQQSEVYPGHAEVPGNGLDDDCDGRVDEPCFIGSLTNALM